MEQTTDDKSKTVKYGTYALIGVMILLVGTAFYPMIKSFLGGDSMKEMPMETSSKISLSSSKEYYNMFQCPCCGKPVDTDCCGMARARKAHVDKLVLDGLQDTELAVEMVKKFGFGTLMDSSQEQEIRDFMIKNAPENPPIIEIENPKYNFGTITQRGGVVSTAFTIQNTGKSDLVIDSLDTSCMCTTASITYQGKESPVFGMSMHGNNPQNFAMSIPPGQKATLNVHYDPNAHGPMKTSEQRITREVTIMSNDPVNFQKKVRIDLMQTP